MDLLRGKRQLHRGFGDSLARAFELAVTTLIFFGIGWALDAWLGTTPWFMIGLSLFALVGQFIKLWYAYDIEMRQHEDEHRARIRGGHHVGDTGQEQQL